LFREGQPKRRVKCELGYLEPVLAVLSPLFLTLIGIYVLYYGFLCLLMYYAGLIVLLLEVFHIVFDRE
jgi:hypothetical protein